MGAAQQRAGGELGAGVARSTSETAALLRSSRLFTNLPTRQLKAFIRYSTGHHVTAGTKLLEQGEPGHFMAVIVAGSCELQRDGDAVTILGPGQWIGEMSMIDGLGCSGTVVTNEATDLLVLRRSDFDHVLKVAPGLSRALMTQLAMRLRELQAAPGD